MDVLLLYPCLSLAYFRITSTCCQFTPTPDGEESCYAIDYLEKLFQAEPTKDGWLVPTDSDPTPKSHEDSRRRRQASDTVELDPELMLLELQDKHAPSEYVKSVFKIA